MKEITFLKQNSEKWQQFETLITTKGASDPDLMADLFIRMTDDLSYSKTHYPKAKTTQYLNSIAARVHQEIYKNKKEKRSRIITFWKYELPFIFKNSHKQLLYSFLIFSIAMLIGIVSTAYDDSFTRLVLGDTYVNMTLENISKGDPMAVYKSGTQIDMFLGITVNNIKVSFCAFALGILLSFGTAYILFFNGVMLGTFQYFFYSKGLLLQSSLVIWIHGTLEISAIVIAGCAGLTMGNSILFPGTYSRGVSFVRGAKQGVKIAVGLIPIFITAGFLESFVTRYSGMPIWLSISIIATSLSFIVWYFIIYPIRLHNKAVAASGLKNLSGS
ncbi:MAG: stage II sporulation protein M [Bacteroidia bacterium]